MVDGSYCSKEQHFTHYYLYYIQLIYDRLWYCASQGHRQAKAPTNMLRYGGTRAMLPRRTFNAIVAHSLRRSSPNKLILMRSVVTSTQGSSHGSPSIENQRKILQRCEELQVRI